MKNIKIPPPKVRGGGGIVSISIIDESTWYKILYEKYYLPNKKNLFKVDTSNTNYINTDYEQIGDTMGLNVNVELSMDNKNNQYKNLKYIIPFSKMTGLVYPEYLCRLPDYGMAGHFGMTSIWANKTNKTQAERSQAYYSIYLYGHKCFRPVMNIKYEK